MNKMCRQLNRKGLCQEIFTRMGHSMDPIHSARSGTGAESFWIALTLTTKLEPTQILQSDGKIWKNLSIL